MLSKKLKRQKEKTRKWSQGYAVKWKGGITYKTRHCDICGEPTQRLANSGRVVCFKCRMILRNKYQKNYKQLINN
jgi:uncharacterized Zn finger protein (UPF0148 family)